MTPKGLLTVVGTIDIKQFWPATTGPGSSDADTVHLKVDPNSSFIFSSGKSATPGLTKKYTGAYVIDSGKQKRVITAKNEIKIRLQGIDAPELHFPVMTAWDPSKKGKFGNDFRQPYGASAANALHQHLAGHVTSSGSTLVHATLVTRIDHPGDAVDSHGRFVGDIIVGTASGKSINTWLVENGWAYPLLYDSMLLEEIQVIQTAWRKGKVIAGAPGAHLQSTLQPFDPSRTVSNASMPDGGALNFPKLFRRQATFWVGVPGELTPAEFLAKMKQGAKGKSDTAYTLDYFKANYAKLDPKKKIKLPDRITPEGGILFEPDGLVFIEDPSFLYSANGKKVTGW